MTMNRSDVKIDAKLGELLLARNVLSETKLKKASDLSRMGAAFFVDTLCADPEVDENLFYEALSEYSSLPYLNLRHTEIPPAVVREIPIKVAAHYGFMLVKMQGRLLTVAVDYPLSVRTQDEIRLQLGYELSQVLSKKKDILESLKKFYGLGADTVERIVTSDSYSPSRAETVPKPEDIDKSAPNDASMIQLVNEIIHDAFQKRSTDIHFEPYRGAFRLRYRVDGMMRDVPLPEKTLRLIPSLLSRIKIMANLDVVERRLPQDGRALVKVKDKNLDLRVSCIPTAHGESVVIRILPTQMIFDLKKLGLSDANVSRIEELIQRPNGIVLLTGPTGSGKTTTLYACLQKINSSETKIVTIEDPVEYEIPGITQIQIAPKVGLDFAKGLRSMLRHDPDVMMVGEIRDFETAEIAIRAALTGHLVFSTLHTNDAASGITRLLDIGVEPFLAASSVEAIIAQRLVRTICPRCRTEDGQPSAALRKKIAADIGVAVENVTLYIGKGCEDCGQTGYLGRTAIHEVLTFTEELKELVGRKSSAQAIKARALKDGMTTLMQDGWKKCLEGRTTPAEVMNAVETGFGTAESSSTSFAADIKEDAASSNPKNQRTFTRVASQTEISYIGIEVYYRIVHDKDKKSLFRENERVALSQNISAGGVLFKTSEVLAPGSILDLKFKLQKSDERIVHCLARVVRNEEGENYGEYMAAVMFLDISTADRVYLNEFVSRLQAEGALDA